MHTAYCSVFTKGTTLGDLDPLCSMLLLSYIHHKREFSAEIHDNIAAVFLQFVNAENLPTSMLLVRHTYTHIYIKISLKLKICIYVCMHVCMYIFMDNVIHT